MLQVNHVAHHSNNSSMSKESISTNSITKHKVPTIAAVVVFDQRACVLP